MPPIIETLFMKFSPSLWSQSVGVIILVSGLFASAVSAAEGEGTPPQLPRRVVVPKLAGELRFDGKLDEAVWKKAAVLEPLWTNDAKGAGTELTTVRVWYDEAALYLGWICQDTDIQATFTERDSKFWEEEVAEFFITSGKLERYFELQWNPLGGVFDAVILNSLDADGLSKKMVGKWEFTAEGMRSAVSVVGTVQKSNDTDEVWQVEVRVPFADLGEAPPKKGDVWRGNFYRFNRTEGKSSELLSWSPTRLPSFHQPSRFGFIEFGE